MWCANKRTLLKKKSPHRARTHCNIICLNYAPSPWTSCVVCLHFTMSFCIFTLRVRIMDTFYGAAQCWEGTLAMCTTLLRHIPSCGFIWSWFIMSKIKWKHRIARHETWRVSVHTILTCVRPNVARSTAYFTEQCSQLEFSFVARPLLNDHNALTV